MKATIPIYLNSNGNVVALSGSLGYSPNSLSNPQVELGSAARAAGMVLTPNYNRNDSVGFLIDSDRTIPSGRQEILRITFDALAGDSDRSDGLAVTSLQATPTPLSGSDAAANLLSMSGHGGYINADTGYVAEGEINAGGSPAVIIYDPPAPYIPPVDNTPIINATPVNTVTPKPTPITPVNNPINVTPIANVNPSGLGNTIKSLEAKAKANPLLLYGGIAAVLWFAFKKK